MRIGGVVYTSRVRIGQPAVETVTEHRERIRLRATVTYATAGLPPDTYWFEVPAALETDLSRSGNPWLAALLPLAATLGEPLEWEVPVDRPLFDGARELLRIWRSWYGETHVVSLHGPVAEQPPPAPFPVKTCAFLSGGVDSFFTALDHGDGDGREERGPIDEFLFVAGLDLRLDSGDAIARVWRSLLEVSQALGRPLVFAATNLRDRGMQWNRSVNWGLRGHGAALASIPLALGARYGQVLIPASNIYTVMVPWGSHPYADNLFSSWTLRVRDDGAAHDRTDKVRAIAGSPLARRYLRVCYKSADGLNCGRCRKCLITMLILDTLVGLSVCPTFPGPLDLRRVRALRLEAPWEGRHLRRLREFAVEKSRTDVVRTIDFVLGWRGRWDHALRTKAASLFGLKGPTRRAWKRAIQAVRRPASAATPASIRDRSS